MGLTFRDGYYNRRVFIGKRTVKQGEKAIYWNLSGRAKRVLGPKRIRLFMSTIQFCTRYTAREDEYLVIEHVGGRTEHVQGPAMAFKDPILHTTIRVERAVRVEAGEAVIVYSRVRSGDSGEDQEAVDAANAAALAIAQELVEATPATLKSASSAAISQCDKNDEVLQGVVMTSSSTGEVTRMTRSIEVGPCLFVPGVHQHLLEFSWHGEAAGSHPSESRVLRGQHCFKKLKLLQQQLYYNVRDVKTSDNCALTIKLLLSYQLVDVPKMLGATLDPIGDFVNALCADVIAYASCRTYPEILESTSMLSNLQTFPQLQRRAAAVGFEVSKVVFRGYKGSADTASAHELATRRRIELKLKREAALSEQDDQDRILDRNIARAEREEQMAAAAQSAQLKRDAAAHEQLLDQKNATNKQQLAYIGALRDMGVDVTKYLIAQAQGKVSTSIIQVDGGGASQETPTGVHVHAK